MCGTKVLKQKSPKIEEAVLMTQGGFSFLGSGVYQTLKRLALSSADVFPRTNTRDQLRLDQEVIVKEFS